MRKLTLNQRKVIADYLVNIGVAWFVAGVISLFTGISKNILDIAISLSWGIGYSLVFLLSSLFVLKGGTK